MGIALQDEIHGLKRYRDTEVVVRGRMGRMLKVVIWSHILQ